MRNATRDLKNIFEKLCRAAEDDAAHLEKRVAARDRVIATLITNLHKDCPVQDALNWFETQGKTWIEESDVKPEETS